MDVKKIVRIFSYNSFVHTDIIFGMYNYQIFFYSQKSLLFQKKVVFHDFSMNFCCVTDEKTVQLGYYTWYYNVSGPFCDREPQKNIAKKNDEK